MRPPDARPGLVPTPAGGLPLRECRVPVGGREWAVLRAAALPDAGDEARYLAAGSAVPYGAALWPSSLALAREVAARPGDFRGRRVLEPGAGTGLPGAVAASPGARAVQTDRHEAALAACRRNGARNGVTGVAYRLADWAAWDDPGPYDGVPGADVLYAEARHAALRGCWGPARGRGGGRCRPTRSGGRACRCWRGWRPAAGGCR